MCRFDSHVAAIRGWETERIYVVYFAIKNVDRYNHEVFAKRMFPQKLNTTKEKRAQSVSREKESDGKRTEREEKNRFQSTSLLHLGAFKISCFRCRGCSKLAVLLMPDSHILSLHMLRTHFSIFFSLFRRLICAHPPTTTATPSPSQNDEQVI